MKLIKLFIVLPVCMMLFSCNQPEQTKQSTENTTAAKPGGQENVKDDESVKDVLKIAMSSKDHTTLVAAIRQADLVTSLSNAGPFTVFAPTNEAFAKLPKETLDALMKDDKKADLQNILQYHVGLSAMKAESFSDGQVLGMANGDNLTINLKDGKVMLNNSATVIASIPASNGIIHVIDAVLLPPQKK